MKSQSVQDCCAYRIEVLGRVDENDINKMSPLEAMVVRVDDAATELAIRTDQSGFIGLIRYFHGRGYVLLSMIRE